MVLPGLACDFNEALQGGCELGSEYLSGFSDMIQEQNPILAAFFPFKTPRNQ
jgi:hypothetical protein